MAMCSLCGSPTNSHGCSNPSCPNSPDFVDIDETINRLSLEDEDDELYRYEDSYDEDEDDYE